MKIVLYGDASIPGTGGWCYAESLMEMGHAVTRVSDYEGLEFYSTWVGRLVRRARRAPLELHRRMHVASLLRAVQRGRPDIVIVLKGTMVGRQDVEVMRDTGAWVVNINHDDFFSLNPNNWSSTQRDAIAVYSYIFTTREVNLDEVRPINPRVAFLPFAYYPRIHHPVPIPEIESKLWQSDVVFIGTWEEERATLMEALARRVDAKYAIWGNGWERLGWRSPLRPYVKGRGVELDDMAKAIGAAKVALGFLRKKNRDDYTQRTFEIPACGGVFLAERTERQQMFYREGVEAEFFDVGAPEELIQKVARLLGDAGRREAMRSAGRAALLRQNHTYRDRLDGLFKIYQEDRAARRTG